MSSVNTSSLLQGFRFIDSFFPSGGYAFSSGLEAAVQARAVRTPEELRDYIADLLRSGLGNRDAVAVGLAHGAALNQTLQTVQHLDDELDAMKLCRDTRLASRQMGKQVLLVAGTASNSPSLLRQFLTKVESNESPGHIAISFGLVFGTFGWNKRNAIAAYLYQSTVGFVSASLKLLPIGQHKGQVLLESLIPIIDQVSREAETKKTMESWSPIQDIHEMQHAYLTTRMFRS